MKTKLVLWGTQQNADETTQKVLVALELKPEDNKVCSWVIYGEAASDELEKELRENWKKDAVVAFPENNTYNEQELSANDSLLPSTIQTEQLDLLKRTQTEWLFVVLSTKLFKDYLHQIDELRQRVEALSKYDKALWDEMKEFWDKIQNHIKEQNLSKEHTNSLRDRTNELFGMLKQLRQAEDEAFERDAKANFDKILANIETIETSAALEGADLNKLFESLKNLQRSYHQSRLTRELRSQLWERIDAAFKNIKERRAPGSSNNAQQGNNENRLSRRIEGLRQAIAKMQESIDRDQKELDFQTKKINSGNATQLETQLREVRGKLIHERIESKRTKLDDMKKTMHDLEERAQRRLEKMKQGETPEAEDSEEELTDVEKEMNNNDTKSE